MTLDRIYRGMHDAAETLQKNFENVFEQDDVIGSDALKDGAVTLDKLSFSKRSANLFNKAVVTSGKYPVWNTGVLQDNAIFSASDYISVAEGATYIKSDTQQVAFYSQTDLGSYVSGIETVDGGKFTVPMDTGIAYVRLTVRNTLMDEYMFVAGDELPGTYVGYSSFITTDSLDPELVARLNYLPPVTRKIIDSRGRYDYTTIQEFIDNEDTSVVEGYILNGEYNEQLELQTRKVTLIGESKTGVIIYNNDGRYTHSPINFGWGALRNLTVKANYIMGESNEIDTNTTGAYAIHLDSASAVGKTIEINNVYVESDFFPAIGCGLRQDCVIEIANSHLKNGQIAGRGAYTNDGTLGALYIHDDNIAGVRVNQKIIVKDLALESTLKNALCIMDVGKVGSEADVTFINNILYSTVSGKESGNIWFRGKDAWTNAFKLNPLSDKNSNNQLNG